MNTDKEQRGRVADFYNGKIILITGATGFIGKVLIWKLLKNCPDLDIIYVLVRPKYGKHIQLRVNELLAFPIFDNFRKENPKLLTKVKAVVGDVSEEKLGLFVEDEEKLIDSVDIVFHGASNLRFTAPLAEAINTNTTGTLRLLQLAEKMTKLKAFIHISTAYCHSDIAVMEEKVYKPNESPDDVIQWVRWIKPELCNRLTDELIKPHPNTYTYSKRLSETVVANYSSKLPVTIIRPSIVIPAWFEPFPGWVDNLNGPVGLLIAAGKGVLRTMWCRGEYFADVVPVDLVCNGLLLAGWKIGTDRERFEEIQVYNLTQSNIEPITWQGIIDLGRKAVQTCPFSLMLWYPGGSIHSNYYVHIILAFLFQWIPAYFIDALLFLARQKTFLVRVQKRIHSSQAVLQYFTNREWKFINDRTLEARDLLNDEDRKIFKLDAEGLNKETYFTNAMLVTRQYILKEDPKTIPAARIRLKLLYFVDRTIKLAILLWIVWIVMKLVLRVLHRNILSIN